jgi:galactokinase
VSAGEAAGVGRVVAAAREHFAERFGGDVLHAAVAPGRVNLIGEHTDYNGGFVLPIAIDRVTAAVLGAGPGDGGARGIEISSASIASAGAAAGRPCASFRFSLDELSDAAKWRGLRGGADGWVLYAAGAIAGLVRRSPEVARVLEKATRDGNLRIAVASSVPVGGGVSSSAAFETAVCRVVEAFAGVELSAGERARLCQQGDHEFVGVPCGIMDQFASSAGRAGCAMLIDCRAGTCEYVPMPSEREAVVLVADTRVRHENANGEYPKRVASCRSVAAKVGVALLRDATMTRIEAAREVLSREELMRARHVVGENARTLAAVAALRAGDLPEFGRLMVESHESLRREYEVSCPELNTLVEAAMAMPGDVFGARMTGGGFGGCVVALVKPGAADRVAARLGEVFEREFGAACGVFVTRASAGAREVG